MEKKVTIFAIDDEEEYLFLLTECLLKQSGYELVTFSDPREALQQCLWVCPDLILVDMLMPIMSGVEFCRELSAHLGSRIPPILVLSSIEDEKAIAEVFEAGARDYLVKPFPSGLLQAKIRKALGEIRHAKELTIPQSCPRRIGRYSIVGEIGRGGMGVVYKAIHPETRSPMALKTLWFRHEDVDVAMRFRREIDVLQSLSHRNLTEVFEVGRSQNVLYYTMEYIRGETLNDRLGRYGCLPTGELISILKQMCEVLGYLHGYDIVHRDIKPSNIMVDESGRAVLMDFGLSKVLTDNQLTATGKVVGTPHFMAPEVVLGAGVDQRSDLFSLGLVLFEMMLGRAVLVADTPYEVMICLAEGRFPRPSKVLPKARYPEGLVRIIDGLLEKDPERRFQSAAQVLESVRRMPRRRA